jgi:hypothetical protein
MLTTDGIGSAYDGTTDGTHNYVVDYFYGGVYELNQNWTQPTLLFRTPAVFQLGITYDPLNNSLWVSGWGLNNVISDYTLGGVLLSSFVAPVRGEIASLAMDYADGTLWFGTQFDLGGPRTFYQFSRAGTELGTQQYANLAYDNYLGGEFAPHAPSAVPEPATLLLLGTGLSGLGMMRRRKAA